MGVVTSQYLLYGAKFPYKWEEGLWEKYGCSNYNKPSEVEGRIIALSDSMGSAYTVIGKCLKKSERYEPLYDIVEFNNLPEIDDETISEINKVVEAYDFTIGPNLEYGFILFTHFS